MLKRFILLTMEHGENLSVLTNVSLFEKINAAFRHSITEKQMEIPESYIQSIVVSIMLIVERSNQANQLDIEEERQFGKLFLEFDKYPLIYELLKEIEEQEIYHFSSKEVQYLTYLIVGSGLRFFMKNESIPFSFRGKVRNLIQKVSEGIQIDSTQDSRLEEDLTIHLYQLFLRIEAQTTVVNPLLDEIKQHYPALYGVVWFSLNDFLKAYHIGISEDEIGFVSIHFQAAVERMRQLNKIVFVCPNGVGTSSFISTKIRRILPNVDSIETASVAKFKEMDISAIDFIISTIDLPDVSKPVARISPMVTNRDMKRIMNHYIDLIIDNEPIADKVKILQDTRMLIAPKIYFERFETKEQALDFLISQNDFSSENQRTDFQRSVLEREALQSTYLDNGFAIPHGNPEFVIETTNQILTWQEAVQLASQPLLNEKAIDQQYVTNMIHSVEENGPYMVLADYFALMHARPGEGVFHRGMSLLVTKNEIDLAGKPVRIFLVLAAKDSQSHLESLQEIMEVFMDQEKYQLILNGDKEQICQLFQ